MEEEEAVASLDRKGLESLRVVDLKQELEKRGLSKSGSKKDLVKRLKLQLDFEKLPEERKSSGASQKLKKEQVFTDENPVFDSNEASKDSSNNRDEHNQSRELSKTGSAKKSNDESLQVSDVNLIDAKSSSALKCAETLDSAITIKISLVNKQTLEKGSSVEICKSRLCASEKVYEHLQVPISPVDSSETINEPANVSKSPADVSGNECNLPEASKYFVEVPQNVYKHPKISRSEDPENVHEQLKVPKSPVEASSDVIVEQNSSLSISNISGRTEDYGKISSINPVDSRVDSNSPPANDKLQNAKPNKIKIIIKRKNYDKKSDSVAEFSDGMKKNNETLTNVYHFGETDNIQSDKAESGVSDTLEMKAAACSMVFSLTEQISSDHSCKQDSVSIMESSQSSSVPYSLSDIKLPESPGNLSTKTVKIEDSSSKMDIGDNEVTKDSSFEDKVKPNGVSEADTVSHHGETSDSESNKSDDSSGKNHKLKKKHDSTDKLINKSSSSRQSTKSESSSEEAVRNKSQLGGKSSKYKDKSSLDTEEQSKDSVDRRQKVLKQQSEDSETESHSDGGHSHMDSKHISVAKRSKYSRQQSDDSENEKSLDSRHKTKGKSDRRRRSSRHHSEEREKSFDSKHKSKDSVDKKKYSRQQSEDRDNEKSLDSRYKPKDDRRQKSSRHRSADRVNEKSSDSKHKSKSSKDKRQKTVKQKSEDRESVESLDSKHKDTDNRQLSEDRDNEKSLDSKHKSKDIDRRHSEDRDEKNVDTKHKRNWRQLSEDKEERSVDSKHKSKHIDRRQQSEDREEKGVHSKHKSKDNVGRRQISRQQFENSENESSGDDEHRGVDSKPRTNDYSNARQQTSLKEQSDESENEKKSDTEKEHSCIDSKQESKEDEDRDKKNLKPQSESENESLGNEHSILDSKNKLEESAVHRPKSPKQHSEDSEKSSDSDTLSSRMDSKHKISGISKVQRRRSHSQSSYSSHSSDSSSKRRRSKKSLVSKSSGFDDGESNQISDKNLAAKPLECENVDKIDAPKVSSKKRIKIKRDNISVENLSSNMESGEISASNKSVEKAVLSVSHSATEKPSTMPESIELQSHEIPYVPRKVSLSNRKLSRKSSEDTDLKSKRSKWGSFASAQKASQTISISTDSLKNWFPDFKLISEPTTPMDLEAEEQQFLPSIEEKPHSSHVDPFDGNDAGVKQQASTSQMSTEDAESQEPCIEEMSEQGPVSKIIFIQNLVRPFTLNQLKELLKQNGKIVEEFFWIDKIKSKCFVMYETEKEACKARNALNNTRWPSSNPKILSVEFSNEEECEQHKKGNEPPPKPVAEPILESQEVIEIRDHPMDEPRRKDRDRRRERERSKPQFPIREWDKDKIIQESPERELTKEEKPRSSEKDKKKESKKRPNEDTSAKLLDHLFQKTKSAPCIYWLPLTEEQAKQKEEAKKVRKMEREKHNQMKEQEETERRNRRARSGRRSREKENRKSSTRSRSPVPRRR